MRVFLVVLALAAVAIGFSALAFADTAPCSDGTAYFACSVTPGNVGYRCSPGGLVRDLTCQCEDVQGYITQGSGDSATCVLAKCSDGTTAGVCSPTKPKMCVQGQLVDNATACGCPSGMQMSTNGISCQYLPCSDGTKNGACSTTAGKMCVQGTLVDNATSCPCTPPYTQQGNACVLLCSDQTPAGQCSTTKPKFCSDTGYLLDNSGKCGCPSGQVADPSGARCVAGSAGLPGSDVLGGTSPSASNTTATGTTAGIGGLSCCCLPTALIGLVGGFVFVRRRK